MRLALLFSLSTGLFAIDIPQFQSHDFSFPASASGNPFNVALSAEFSGPGGLRLNIPGFYDGNGVWKVRFSPTRTGAWTMLTRSSLPSLDKKSDSTITCVPNPHPNIHGSLQVDPAHPYHFVFEDGTRYFLMGYEADWLWGIDMNDPKRTEMHKLIDRIASRGFNHVMVNVYAHDTGWSAGKQNRWDYGPPEMYAWEGSNEKPDHTRLNPKFFQLYDAMMEALRDKGIVAHIMLKVYNKRVNWPEKNSPEELRYFQYVTARYQAFSNVVWDFAKESYNEKDNELQARLINYVRSNDAYRRLMTAHDDDAYEWDPQFNYNLDFRTDQQHTDWAQMIAFDRAMRARPVLNSEFGYERGFDKLPTYRIEHDWEEQLRRAWLVYMAGGYGVYYYHYTSWDVVKVDPEPAGLARFQILKNTLSALPYWKMDPAPSLAVGGTCLASRGELYACYLEGKNITMNLHQLDSVSSAEWVNTWTGARESVTPAPGKAQKFEKPAAFAAAPALLVIKR